MRVSEVQNLLEKSRLQPKEVQAHRLELGWKQGEFGAALGLDQTTVSRWETGKANPPLVFHVVVRALRGKVPDFSFQEFDKKKEGRPLKTEGFDRSKAKCPWPTCRKPGRQMWREGALRENCILGQLCPLHCEGIPGSPHPRVTRYLDRRGLLWDISKLPRRKKLAPFEKRGVASALKGMGSAPSEEAILLTLARCTDLDGHKGCGRPLRYHGHPSTTDKSRRRLHLFLHPAGRCKLRWIPRFFDSKGNEQRRVLPGGARKPPKYRIPRKARNCPRCRHTFGLGQPVRVHEIGGVRYDPPLWKLVCPNPDKVDHRDPHRHRSGTTFYYNPRRARFERVYSKPIKQGGPPRSRCRKHGRMRRTNFYPHQLARVPKKIQTILEIQKGETVHRDYCPCTYVWKRNDGKQYRQPRPLVGPYRSKLSTEQLEAKMKASARRYEKEHRDEIRKRTHKYRKAHRKELRAYFRDYTEKNREKLRKQKHRSYLKRKRSLGGKPMPRQKFNIGDRVKANEKAPGDYKGAEGTVVELGPGRAEYGVAIESDKRAAVHHLNSWWLDRRGS